MTDCEAAGNMATLARRIGPLTSSISMHIQLREIISQQLRPSLRHVCPLQVQCLQCKNLRHRCKILITETCSVQIQVAQIPKLREVTQARTVNGTVVKADVFQIPKQRCDLLNPGVGDLRSGQAEAGPPGRTAPAKPG